MRLMYLKQEGIDDIKMNFSKYKSHFTDDTNEWFMKVFEENHWLCESKIECSDFEMNYNNDFNVSDTRNVKIVYDVLKDLKPANALDERLWAGMLFSQFWNFVKYRRKSELNSGVEKDVLNSFFFMRGTKRSCFMNCLSRLWWTGYLFYDKDSSNHYKAVDLICDSAYASNILLISSNNFIANKNVALGITDCLLEREYKDEKIGRYHYVEANKYLNCIGAVSLFDTLSRDEIKELINKHLNKYFDLNN